MDTNFCFLLRYNILSLHQQSTNGEHSEELVNFQDTHLTTVHARKSVTQVFSWQPIDSYQLEVINAKKSF